MMNRRQKGVLIFGVLLFSIMFVFPPIERVAYYWSLFPGGIELKSDEPEFAGYWFYFSVPDAPSDHQGRSPMPTRLGSYRFQIAKDVLLDQLLCLGIVILVLIVAFRSSRPALPWETASYQRMNFPHD
jgi:hypothetical protein